MTVAESLRRFAAEIPDQICIDSGSRKMSYREVDLATDQIAASLLSLGIAKGDRVALQLSNSPELILCYFGCFKSGAVAVPVNNRFAPAEVRYTLNHSKCRAAVSQPDLVESLLAVRDDLPEMQNVFTTGTVSAGTGTVSAETQAFSELLRAPAVGREFPAVSPADPAAILYTSGTTSRPKGVTHSHGTLAAAAESHRQHIGVDSTDVLCIIPPMCHILGFACQLMTGICAGARLVLPDSTQPEVLLKTIQETGATRIAGLPVMFQSLVNCPTASQFSLRTLKTAIAGGDAVPLALQERFLQTFGVQILEGCGMTEIIPFTLNVPGAHRPGSIGRACSGVTIRLVRPDGEEARVRETGEILARGAGAMTGYWLEPDLSAEVLAGGFVHTGDLAWRDEDDFYWFAGRRKEIIIRGGSNISPLEVEEEIYRHPSVRECGVAGVPHESLGEVPWAWVTVREHQQVSAEELRRFLADRLAAYKIPERIFFVESLPRGVTGKISRRMLKQLACEADG